MTSGTNTNHMLEQNTQLSRGLPQYSNVVENSFQRFANISVNFVSSILVVTLSGF